MTEITKKARKVKPKAFLICPVRGHDPKEFEAVVADLESKGWQVHYPPRDTNQEDKTGGINICKQNRQAIVDADRVFIIWDGKSQGGLFDAGMAFALKKPLTCVKVPAENLDKAFQNVFLYWAADGA